MSTFDQSRIYELETYVQKEVGEEGYIDPAELLIIVDHPTWSRSKKMVLTGGASQLSTHQENSRITNPPSSTITVTFGTAFAARPVGFHKVYRITTEGSDERYYDVLIKHEQVTNTGIIIVIDDSESLNGVIVEWFYV